MTMISLILVLALSAVNLDIVTLPLSNDVKVVLAPSGRAELKREGTVTRIKIEIERPAPPTTLGPALITYVVWAITPEGILDNLGELDVDGSKGQFNATTRFGEFGLLITAEPHYMVDRPSSAVAYRSQTPAPGLRRKTVPIEVGAYDYSTLKPISAVGVHGAVTQARLAFQIAQGTGAEQSASMDFRSAQVAMGALEQLIARATPIDILLPAANEAIRLSQRAAASARAKR